MSDNTVVTENTVTNIVEVTSAGPAGPPGGALTIQDQGVSEGLLTDKLNFAGSTVSVNNDTVNEIATVTINAATPGANANITSMTGVTGGISSPDFIQFDTAAGATGAVGRMLWNDTDGTLEFQMKGGNVTLQVGQEEVLRVTNQSGSAMTDGQVVYITGSTGNHLNVTLSQANSEATSSKTLAVVAESIANNGTGFATTSGLIRNLNTSALTEGAAIWLSPTVPGGLTSTKPVAPNHAVLIGWCVKQHATVGVIYVHIANGYELEELHNVLITSVANNQVLRYDSATSLWKNATISPTVTLAGAVTGSGTLTDLGNVTITTTATSDPTLTLSGDASGSATFTNLGDATLTVTVADNSHDHTIANVTGLQTALDLKAPLASPTFTGSVILPATTAIGTVSATEIGYLDGVTSAIQTQIDTKLASASYTAADVLTKIKTVDGSGSGLDADLLDGQDSAYYTAINARLGYTAENAANKGVAGGYASLDGAGLVPSTQLPSYVDDVLEYANLAAFPVTGESGKIYVAIDTAKTYRWSGSTYVEISASPGTTDALTEGSVNLYFTQGRARSSLSAGTGISYNSSTGAITNSAPDQTVSITGSGTTSVTGTYPNFTVASADQYVGTVTSVAALTLGTTGTDLSSSVASGTTTPVITLNVPTASATNRGALSSTDWSTFNAKQAALVSGTNIKTVGGATLLGSGDVGTIGVAYGGTGATSLTSGYLVKGNGTSAASASVVYDDGTNVGIGTSSPGVRLDVLGGIRARGGTPGALGANNNGYAFSNPGDNDSGMFSSADGQLEFYLNNAEVVRFVNGNVGIGTTAPTQKLDVNGVIKGGVASGVTLAMADNSAIRQSGASGGTMYFDVATGGATHGAFDFRSSNAFTSRMYINSSGDVGIGTSSPAVKLDVYNAGFAAIQVRSDSSSEAQLRFNTNIAARISNQSNTALIFDTNNTERMRIDASGNVGIGTTAPGYKLDIVGNSPNINLKDNTAGVNWYQGPNSSNLYTFGNNAGSPLNTAFLNTNVGIGTSSPGQRLDVNGSINTANNLFTGNGSGVWFNGSASFSTGIASSTTNMTFYTSNSERMRIDSSGNVGIGTSSPGQKLDVAGSAQASNLLINVSAATIGYADNSASFIVYNGTGSGGITNTIRMVTNGSERARITSSGDLLVGQSAGGFSNGNSMTLEPSAGYCVFNHLNGTASGTKYHYFAYNGGEIGSITQNGTTAVAYNTTSDYRLKDINGPIQNSGAYIDALKPVQGSWKADGSRFIGLIAHEVQEVSETQIATGVKDGEEMQAMDYSAPELIANLIAEIQSLRARVAQLEGK